MRLDAYITEYARKTPQSIALEEGNNSVSYFFLNKEIDTIASFLMDSKQHRYAILAESGI